MEKNKLMMIIIIVLLVVLLGAIAFFSFFVIRLLNSEQQSGNNLNSQTAAVTQKLSKDQITEIPIKDAFTSNLLAGTDGEEHQIRFSVVIGINNTDKKESPKVTALITANADSSIRSIISKIIRNKTYQDMTRPDAQDVLEGEILAKLQEEYNTNLIVEVYVSDLLTI